MRVATSCDTMVRVCGLSARDTVETCTPAFCAICLIPEGGLLMASKSRGWRAAPHATTHVRRHRENLSGTSRRFPHVCNKRLQADELPLGFRVNGRSLSGGHGCARDEGDFGVRAPVEAPLEFRDIQVLFPGGDGYGRNAVADVVDEAPTALHERIDAEQ